MTEKIGAYDFTSLHVLPSGENGMQLFERRLRRVIVTSTGQPRTVIPDGVSYTTWTKMMDPTDRVVRAWVLVPISEK